MKGEWSCVHSPIFVLLNQLIMETTIMLVLAIFFSLLHVQILICTLIDVANNKMNGDRIVLFLLFSLVVSILWGWFYYLTH